MRIALVVFFAIAMGLFGSGNANAGVLCSGNNGLGVAVNNIWCNTVPNWWGSGQTLCVAEQYNFAPIDLRFYVRPLGPSGGTGHSDFRPMQPFQMAKVFAWPDNTNPAPQCILDWPPGSTRLRHH